MSELATRHPATYDAQYETTEHVSGWTGWVGFAGFMMILSGIIGIIDGLVGIFRSSFYVVSNNSSQLLVFQNVKTWGWINLILGAIITLAGFSLFSGAAWARVVAVLMSMLAIVYYMVAIALYPIWSIIAIAVSVFVMYAVIVHGGELRRGD